jgi:cysteine desulfurase/selenocysteine lyase
MLYTHTLGNDADDATKIITALMPLAQIGAAIDYLQGVGMENIRTHEQELVAYATSQMSGIRGLKIYGPQNSTQKSGVVSFNLGSIHPHDLGTVLDEDGIAVRVR